MSSKKIGKISVTSTRKDQRVVYVEPERKSDTKPKINTWNLFSCQGKGRACWHLTAFLGEPEGDKITQ